MTTLNANLVAQIIATISDPLTLSVPVDPLSYTKKISFATGTGIGQGDKLWHATRTILASATDTLDLAGSLTDGLGDPVTFVRIKALMVVGAPANAGNITLRRPATNGVPLFDTVSAGLPIVAGGMLMWVAPTAAGVVVTAGTGDLIDLVNTVASTVNCDVVILGASA